MKINALNGSVSYSCRHPEASHESDHGVGQALLEEAEPDPARHRGAPREERLQVLVRCPQPGHAQCGHEDLLKMVTGTFDSCVPPRIFHPRNIPPPPRLG